MIIIFDLDDTLYDEKKFVISGFKYVSVFLNNLYGWNIKQTFNSLIRILNSDGRGEVFDTFLKLKEINSKILKRKCVNTYRHHTPNIFLKKEIKNILINFKKSEHSIYLLTDGHKVVQKNKINALGIEKFFKKIFITHRYGIKNAKPSTYCFKIIKKIEKCNWGSMLYIGDNPNKDFVNLKPLGMKTIRIMKGVHAKTRLNIKFEASFRINSLAELSSLIKNNFK